MIDPIPTPENANAANWSKCPKVIRAHQEALDKVLRLSDNEPIPEFKHEFGVLYVGGGIYWPSIAIGCHMLRHFGYAGPIQVWHGLYGNPEPIDVNDVAGLDVEIIDSLKVAEIEKPRILRGWESKIFALKNCNFKRALFLDADAYCVDNPDKFIDVISELPIAYWQDLDGMLNSVNWSAIWPEPVTPVPPFQGGQFYIDRVRAWPLINTVYWMTQHSDFYFNYGYGDQDCMRAALTVGDWKYNLLGRADWRFPAFVCSINESPLVIHRCQGKIFNTCDYRAGINCVGPNYAIPKEREMWEFAAKIVNKGQTPERVFSHIYSIGLWGDGSGNGSNPEKEGRDYVTILSALINFLGVSSIVDVGCGDGRIIKAIANNSHTAVNAIDCVRPILKQDTRINFMHGDIFNVDNIPSSDMLLIKDVMQHWPNKLVVSWMNEIIKQKRWKYIVATHDRLQMNDDTFIGGYRGLDPNREPLKSFGPWRSYNFIHKAICFKEI